MDNWVAMFGAFGRRWWALMSCAAFTGLSAIAAHYSLPAKTVEYVLIALAVLFGFLALAFEWIDEHKRLISEIEGRKADQLSHTTALHELRASRDDFSFRLRASEARRFAAVNRARPEVFAQYSSPMQFEVEEPDEWQPEDRAVSLGAVCLNNSGHSCAFEVSIDDVITEAFIITFSKIQRVDVGVPAYADATLYPRDLKFIGEQIAAQVTEHAGNFVFYEATRLPLQVDVHEGINLLVQWRDSNNNFFFSVTKQGQESVVQNMDAPITAAEMAAAYEDAEDSA